MTPWLYLETNFLLSFAYGQNPDSERLLLAIEAKAIHVVLPEVCIVEAIASWRNGRSRLLDLTKDYMGDISVNSPVGTRLMHPMHQTCFAICLSSSSLPIEQRATDFSIA